MHSGFSEAQRMIKWAEDMGETLSLTERLDIIRMYRDTSYRGFAELENMLKEGICDGKTER